jgi:hypothetical protein
MLCTPSSVEKVAAAISPENDVAKMLPEYRIDIRVAISFLV